jgi:regulatory protein
VRRDGDRVIARDRKTKISPLINTDNTDREKKPSVAASFGDQFVLFQVNSRLKRFCYASCEMPFKPPKEIVDENALYDYAVRSLGRRMRTVAELKRLMRQRVPKDEIGNLLVEMVILRLKEQKYLNDTNYAAAYSSFRRDNEKFGRRRVITDLKVKGVHQDVIEKVVDEAYAAVNEEELARAYLKRKRLKKPANEKDAARIFRGLMRAGFGVGVAIKVLKNWEVEDELLTALQEEAEE